MLKICLKVQNLEIIQNSDKLLKKENILNDNELDKNILFRDKKLII